MRRGSVMKATSRSWPPQRSQKQGIDLKDPPNEVGPSTSERCLAGRAENGIGRDRRSELIRSRPLALKTASAAEVGVSTVVKVM
jgi:hypothetical protein